MNKYPSHVYYQEAELSLRWAGHLWLHLHKAKIKNRRLREGTNSSCDNNTTSIFYTCAICDTLLNCDTELQLNGLKLCERMGCWKERNNWKLIEKGYGTNLVGGAILSI